MDFFTAPDDSRRLTFSFNGITPITPQIWSHHLVRFDASTGLLEYLVNGQPESVLYMSSTGREGGEVYTPVIGEGSRLVLGGRYAGLLDEFRLYGGFAGEERDSKYPSRGGRVETEVLELGERASRLLRLDVRGGRITAPGSARERVIPATGAAAGITPGRGASGLGSFSFDDDSAIQFFIRSANSFSLLSNTEWLPVRPGVELPEIFQGRYAQIAAQLYPSGDGESTPYLDEIRLVYLPDEPPRPPSQVSVLPRDGGVELSWRNSPDQDTLGYLVYYGTSRGVFFGEDAILGISPINVGKPSTDEGRRLSVRIDGLTNGVLYYFVVVAYDRMNPIHGGAFSPEVSARPLRMYE
jgi:hypothetical protein